MAGKQADIKVGVITNYDDKGLKQAEGGLKGFKASIKDADGVGGKLKAGWSSATDSIKANAGSLAMAGGAALVAFGVKAVGAFTDTAKAALDLGTSTGLSVEEASRWIAVGDDFEVSATALATGLGKVSKTLDDTKWKKYGIETRDASGEARSANDIMIDAFDTLSKVTNETDRARIGQELFGKGYQSLTPILGHTREEYVKMLGAVEKGQVITAQEAKKAEKFRLAQDQLSDSLKDIQISVGGVVAGLSPMIEQTSKTVTKLADLVAQADAATESIGGLGNVVMSFGNPLAALNVVQSALTDVVDESNMSLEELIANYTEAGASTETLARVTQRWYEQHKEINPELAETEKETRLLSTAMGEVRDREAEATEKAAAYARQVDKTSSDVQADIDAIQAAWDTLTGNLNNEKAWINLKHQADDVKQANIDAGDAIKKYGPGSPEAIAALEDARLKSIDLELATSDYAKEVAGLPVEKVTEIAAMIGAGDVDAAMAAIDTAFATHSFRINAHLDNIIVDGETHAAGSNGKITVSPDKIKGARASGGHVSNGAWLVGEDGPEILQMNGVSGNILPNGQMPPLLYDGGGQGNGVGGSTIIVNAGLGTDGYQLARVIVNLLAEYDRRNGTVITRGRGR